MEESKDKSIHHMTIKICEDLKVCPSYQALFQDLQVGQQLNNTPV